MGQPKIISPNKCAPLPATRTLLLSTHKEAVTATICRSYFYDFVYSEKCPGLNITYSFKVAVSLKMDFKNKELGMFLDEAKETEDDG